MNFVKNVTLNIIPIKSLAGPTPPPGSDFDQSTLDYEIDQSLLVAGGIDGDPSKEHYLLQGIKNDRSPTTGYGGVLGYVGNVTKPLYIGLAATKINPNSTSPEWLKLGSVDPSDLEEGKFYYVYATFPEDPLNQSPDTTFYMIAATDEDFTMGTEKYWTWAGISSAPYTKGVVEVFNGTQWNTPSFTTDTVFFTFTESEDPYECSDYENLSDCVAAGCYWYGDACHSTPQNGDEECPDYTTKPDCEEAGCFWYKKYIWEEEKCHGTEQNMLMDYLPFIIAGVGVGVVLIAVTMRSPRPQPQYYPPQYPPQQYPQQYPYRPPPHLV